MLHRMRIIAGEFRRRLLLTPSDAETTRPYPDRVKESLFSLLRGHFEGASVFDGFAGVGTIGLEAVSRGATRCVMVERDRHVAALLQKNIETLGVQDRCEVVIGDALGAGALARCPKPVHLVFLDPPYEMLRDPLGFKRAMSQFASLIDRLTPDGFAVLRTPWPLEHEVEVGASAPGAGGIPPTREGEPAPGKPGAARGTPLDRAEARPRKKKGKGREHWRWEDEERASKRKEERGTAGRPEASGGEEEVELEEDEWRALMDGKEEAPAKEVVEEPASVTPIVERKLVELTLPNATGPETHAYHSMAVHLYMRKRAE